MTIPRRRLGAVGLLVAAVTSLGMAAATPAAATSANPAAPAHPPTVSQRAAVPGPDAAAPAGQHAAKGAPPAAGAAASVSPSALTYMYGTSYQYAATDGMYAYATVAQPSLASGDFHTLAELAAQSSDGQQIVEVGWTVDRGLNGDSRPHLFVYHWVDRTPSCYNGCGYVQYSSTVRPGDALPVGTQQFFAIQHYQGNWWVAYGNQWIGYFPDSLWGGRYTKVGLSQWFGEVSANSGAPCTDMGNGLFASSTSATSINTMGFYGGPTVSKTTYATNPPYYSTVSTSDTSMRYGGPGGC
jgi:hypothetical protein